ncbi:MAG: hypothetical protein U0805_05755 [Pirellulales bacterium]
MPDGIGTWYFHANRESILLVFPQRLLITVFALISIAVAPRIRFHYSLRAMLIAVTVVAIMLGLLIAL